MLKAYVKLLGEKYRNSEAKVAATHKMIANMSQFSKNENKLLKVLGPDNPSQIQFVKKIVKESLLIIKELENNSKSK